MRLFSLAFAILTLTATLAPAQPPAAPPAPPPQPDPRLDTVLTNWQKQLASLKTFEADLTRVEADKAFGSTDTFVGKAWFMAPGRGMIDMKKKDKPAEWERYLSTGTFIYQWVPKEKKLIAYELPKAEQGKAGGDSLLGMIFTIDAAEAKKRYDLTLQRVDENYIYLGIKPIKAEDKTEFTEARLVLNQGTYLPREIYFKTPQGNEVKWDVPKMTPNVTLDAKWFAPPEKPEGWKLETNLQRPEPRKVLPQDPGPRK